MEMVGLHWGLVPSWASDPKIGYKMSNARGETVAEKPSFRSAFKQRRCLIPAAGFYEWRREGKVKQPFFIRRLDGAPFHFAGLWERWEKEGRAIESCTIITTGANTFMSTIHDRMPVVIDEENFDRWLNADAAGVKSLLVPWGDDGMRMYPVTPKVNKAGYDEPSCVEPIGA